MMQLFWVMLGCFAGTVTVAAEIPFPDALDKAAVAESRITDAAREALLVGNGDVRTLVWQHGATLSLRVVKNDVWDARADTSQDPPMMRVDVANQTWSGGGYPPSWKKPYPHPRCAAVVRIGSDGSEPGAPELRTRSARLDLRRAVAEVRETGDRRTTVRVLADRNVLLIEGDRPVALEEIKSPDLPPAELGQTDGVPWLDMKMPGDLDYTGMEYALAVAHKGKCHAVAITTSFDTAGNVLEAAIRLAQETADTDLSELIDRHEQAWQRYWSASGGASGTSPRSA